MNPTHWTAWILLSLASLVVVLYLYRRREPAGQGRTLLALLRWAAVALLLLLLFDPRLAKPLNGTRADRAPVLLDASLSMLRPGDRDSSRWHAAVGEARTRSGGAPIVLFGDGVTTISTDSLSRHRPEDTRSRLLPALQAAAEAGAANVMVITDGAIADADAVARWLPRLGVGVEWVRIPGTSPEATLSEIAAPAWAEAGEPVDVTVGVQAAGAAQDSASVVVRQDGRVLGVQRIAMPADGRVTQATLRVRPAPPPGGGQVHLVAELEAGDRFTDDNVRHAYVYVSDEPSGIVLLSLAPDWEPRFLLPVLQRATGLPARGFLRTGDGRWLRVAGGLDAGARLGDVAVQRALAAADLVVLHNLSGDAPSWVQASIADASRLIVLPAADAQGLPLPVRMGAAAMDDWFVSADVPPSPVAPLLTGMQVGEAPPLAWLREATPPEGAWAPMLATRGRRGAPSPLAIAGEEGSRRWAVALGSGYWRWAFRGDAAGDVYARLWSTLGGWLMRGAPSADIAVVRPVQRAVARGEPVRWVTRAGPLDSLRVRMPGATLDTVVVARNDTAALPVLPPGTYGYDVTAYVNGDAVRADGELTVESYSPEFAREAATLPAGDVAALRERSAETTPLHASVLPYAILLLLLCAEWILRRRWGLR